MSLKNLLERREREMLAHLSTDQLRLVAHWLHAYAACMREVHGADGDAVYTAIAFIGHRLESLAKGDAHTEGSSNK